MNWNGGGDGPGHHGRGGGCVCYVLVMELGSEVGARDGVRLKIDIYFFFFYWDC